MIPEHMMDAIDRYVDHGINPGGFLTAVICNDLAGAFQAADHINKPIIEEYMWYFWNDTPSPCWGSEAKMRVWIERQREERSSE